MAKLIIYYTTSLCVLYSFPCLISGNCKLADFANSDNTVENDKITQSETILKRLEPLHGKIYTSIFTEENGDKYEYTLSICSPLTYTRDSTTVGLLQKDLSEQEISKQMHIVGRINDTDVKAGTDWIMLTYKFGDPYNSHCKPNGQDDFKSRRRAHIMLVCNPNDVTGKLRVLYEENTGNKEEECFYMLELSTSEICKQNSGLSGGSIFLIVIFSLTAVYLIVGIAYKRYVYGSRGKEQIPNFGFWKAFGALQADGCNYLCRCDNGGYSSSESAPYRGIADDQLEDEGDDEHLLPM